jgi:calcium-dependent protein kinase
MDVRNMKLADFGTAGPYDKSGKIKLSEVMGTPYYVAPEVLNESYDEKCDIWSIGVMAFLLLSGKLPFTAGSLKGIFAKIKFVKPAYNGDGWNSVSTEGADFVQKLLNKNKSERPSAKQALMHPWIVNGPVHKPTGDNKAVLENLKDFRAHEVLKQATYAYMASQLVSKTDKEELGKMFKAEDKNGDGHLDKKELIGAF